MKRKWRGVEVRRAQVGWYIEVDGTVETHRQFTDEQIVVEESARWLWLAVIRGFMAWRAEAKRLQAIQGDYNS